MRLLVRASGACALLVLFHADLRAQEPAPAAPKTAEELLDQVEKTLQQHPAYSCDARLAVEVSVQEVQNKFESEFAIRVERPRKWAVDMKAGVVGGSSISDGKEVTTYLAMTKRYTVAPLEEDWDPAGSKDDPSTGSAAMLEPHGVARTVMGHNLKAEFLDGVESSELREDKLGETECWVAALTKGDQSIELWVAKTGPALIQQGVARRQIGGGSDEAAEADDADAETAPDDEPGMSMTMRLEFSNWNLKPEFSTEDFAFTPPEGAEESDSLFEMPEDEGPHPLVGEPAPEFEADVLDGEKFTLAEALKEQKVVMLDFWATWCGPCVAALPQVTEAAKELQDKGVVFFAVNLMEEPDKVRDFLKEHELEAPVLLDADGAIGQQYGAEAIPQTVLIGKDGRVHVVHVGAGGDMKKMLLDDLTQLLEGKDLAAETLAKKEKAKADADKPEADTDADAAADEKPTAEAAAEEKPASANEKAEAPAE